MMKCLLEFGIIAFTLGNALAVHAADVETTPQTAISEVGELGENI